MNNPFDDAGGTFLVLINHEGQYSIWPTYIAVPDGWSVKLDGTGHQACVDYINENWTDMRPASLIENPTGR